MFIFSPLFWLSCKGEKKWTPSSALDEYVRQMKDKLFYSIEISPKDSGFWIGTCWNLYQLTEDSCFFREAEKSMQLMRPVCEYEILDTDKALYLYWAFSKGFDITGKRRYKYEIWNLAERLLADSLYINNKTIEILLWGTARKGCHCFREEALRWISQQSMPTTVEDMQGLASLYLYTDSLIYLNKILDIDVETVARSFSDSIRIISIYTQLMHKSYDKKIQNKISSLLLNPIDFSKFSLEDCFYYSGVFLEKD